jgi:hypothetical protein
MLIQTSKTKSIDVPESLLKQAEKQGISPLDCAIAYERHVKTHASVVLAKLDSDYHKNLVEMGVQRAKIALEVAQRTSKERVESKLRERLALARAVLNLKASEVETLKKGREALSGDSKAKETKKAKQENTVTIQATVETPACTVGL